jgi:hypothetical protein
MTTTIAADADIGAAKPGSPLAERMPSPAAPPHTTRQSASRCSPDHDGSRSKDTHTRLEGR